MVIIAIIAVIAVARYSAFAERAKFTGTHAAFLQIDRALELYHADFGSWPPNADQGVQPQALRPYLAGTPITKSPPLGGAWDWNGIGTIINAHGYNMGIRQSPAPVALWTQFDAMFDDGNLSTGTYRRDGVYLVRLVSPP